MFQNLNRKIVTSMIAAAAACSAALAQSDDCASPTPISGNVLVSFDLSIATPSGQGNLGSCSGTTGGFLGRDVWFCWTAECTGMVRISTCGLTQGDTIVAIYPETVFCSCPGDAVPLCCNDNFCLKQSEFTCEVVCGRRYLIQVGTRVNDLGFDGQVSITCQGEPCGGLTAPNCDDCCGTRPPIVDNLSAPFAPGQVAAVTFGREDSPAGNIGVLRLVGIGDQSSAPLVGSGSLWSPQEYAHPSWNLSTLGSIFGVAFDGQGNIFVAHSVAYSNDLVGSLGVSSAGDGRGAIYRINGATGVPSLFRTLPQASGAAVGLGNLDFDCGRDCLFATDFEDGRIYSINATTGAISAFDHQTGAVEAESAIGNGAAIAEGPNPGGASSEPAGFAGYGNVPYAVKVAGDRVYYSVWQSYGSAQTIHSVQIDFNGFFVTGTGRLELSIPYAPGHPYQNINCPIADISFDANCCMLIAERSMSSESNPSAHNSRAWRACFNDASASWNAVRYDIGSILSPLQPDWQNSSGGIDYVDGFNGEQAWLTGDFFSQGISGSYYGISGIPLVESNGSQLDTLAGPGINMTSIKTAQGSLDITCLVADAPCEFATEDIDCVPTANGGMNFLWTVTITNGSNSSPANLLILGDPIFAPNNVMFLNPPLGPSESMTLNIPISGANPGDTFCFTATLAASFKDECCTEEICLTLPECRCFDYDVEVNAIAGSTGFTVNLTMVNITQPAFNGEWVTVAVPSIYPATVSPSLINILTTPYGASVSTGAITVSTALPAGSLITLIVGLHSQSFNPCCFVEVEVFVPANQDGSSNLGDLNGDGMVDAADLARLISGWGFPGASDINGDGNTNSMDLAIVLSNWG